MASPSSSYRADIPQVFWYNALIILSSSLSSRVGSATSPWGDFTPWKRVSREDEEGSVSLKTVIDAIGDRRRLLDLVENYTLYKEGKGGLEKIVARYHQYLGVENALLNMADLDQRQGRLGVFWHTQGSGKSFSMVFFGQKVLRKLPGNWTFLVITDRVDLDDQIYGNFMSTGVLTLKDRVQAKNSSHLRQLLRDENHRYVFTLIHKFRTEKGVRHDVLSERDDIIVITDEAHRSQYDTLALNMRTALPNASFIAFTGTPLLMGEERTRETFGDYVSIYNFKQAIDDDATVALYYENRIPELQLTNDNLNDDIYRVIEDAELDDRQEERLEKELGRPYHLITRDDRLETVAEDIVEHFISRGFVGKAMVVSIDKATAIKTYNKVKSHWQNQIVVRKREARRLPLGAREPFEARTAFMEETDMAVVVSGGQGEKEKMRQKGVDIAPHRQRMEKEKRDDKFKDPEDPLRLVFICAMWLTGFNVRSCSTIYLDKPMRDHTLMQTIARANRVFEGKAEGIIVDYVGVFQDLQKALSIYGSDSGGRVQPGDIPVVDKAELLGLLKEALKDIEAFCASHGVDLDALQDAFGAERLEVLAVVLRNLGAQEELPQFDGDIDMDPVMDKLLEEETRKQEFLARERQVSRFFKSVLPNQEANEVAPRCALLGKLAADIRALNPPADIYEVMADIDQVLDGSVVAEAYVIHDQPDPRINLAALDFEALEHRFQHGFKHIELEKLKSATLRKLKAMLRQNPTRMDYMVRFQELIDNYNAGASNVEELFKSITKLCRELTEEDQRAIREGLSEEELTFFDLLTRPRVELTEKQRQDVKALSRSLLETLKKEKLVLDWRKRQQARAAVRVAIEDALEDLPESAYPNGLWAEKCGAVYDHVYHLYSGHGSSTHKAA